MRPRTSHCRVRWGPRSRCVCRPTFHTYVQYFTLLLISLARSHTNVSPLRSALTRRCRTQSFSTFLAILSPKCRTYRSTQVLFLSFLHFPIQLRVCLLSSPIGIICILYEYLYVLHVVCRPTWLSARIATLRVPVCRKQQARRATQTSRPALTNGSNPKGLLLRDAKVRLRIAPLRAHPTARVCPSGS